MCERLAAADSTSILFLLDYFLSGIEFRGQGVPRSGACTLVAEFNIRYPNRRRRKKSIHLSPMATSL